MFGLVAELLLHSSLKSHDGRFRLFGCGNRVSYLGVLHPKVNRVRVSYYIAEPELKSSFIGALSPVNHKGLHQGWTQTSLHLQVIYFTSHHTIGQSLRLVLVNIISRTINISVFMSLIATFGWLGILSRCFLNELYDNGQTFALAITNTLGKRHWFLVLDDRLFSVSITNIRCKANSLLECP